MARKLKLEAPRLPDHDLHDEANRLKKVGGYIIGKSIGEGSFAKVKEAIHILTNMRVAVKVIDKTEQKDTDYIMRNLHREADVLRKIRHSNIVQLYEVMETENHYYLVLELVRGGDLMTHICKNKRLSEIEAQKYTRQIISAVDYLHAIGVVHRDLKVENLLLDEDNNIKIIDFGLSNNLGKNGLLGTQCGSPAYAAPEVFSKNPYGPSVDIWSIGINLYAMLTGQLPFHVEPINIAALHEKIMKGAKIPNHLTEECQDLLSKLLVANEDERINMIDLMKHPWVNGSLPQLEPHKKSTETINELDLEDAAIEALIGVGIHYNDTISQALINMGIDYNDTIHSLKGMKPTKYAATYYLLVEKFSSPRKISLPRTNDIRRGSVDPMALQRAAEKSRGVLSPSNKRRIKKSPQLKLPEQGERISLAKSAGNTPDVMSDTEPNLEGYNVKQRKSSMGETIQNFIKDKLHKSPTVEEKGHRITEPATNKKSGERRTSIADFLKSPLDISKKRDRSQSLPQTGDFKEEKPEVATVDAAESSNSRSPTRLGMFSPKSKNKRTTPANVLCNG